MRIIKNTTPYRTQDLARIIRRVHAHMKKLERRSAPNWRGLRVEVRVQRKDACNYQRGLETFHGGWSGWAAYYGRHPNRDWDVLLIAPNPARFGVSNEHAFAKLVYHELMHTYGYNHSQFSEIPQRELDELFPDNELLQTNEQRAQLAARKVESERQARREEAERLRRPEFPLVIPVSRKARDEFYDAEYGLHEDTLAARERIEAGEAVDEADHYLQRTTCEIIDGSAKAGGILVRNPEELNMVLWAADSGVWGIYCPVARDRFIERCRTILSRTILSRTILKNLKEETQP